jgi:hypothetical protein
MSDFLTVTLNDIPSEWSKGVITLILGELLSSILLKRVLFTDSTYPGVC